MEEIYENTIVAFADYADVLNCEISIDDEACKCQVCNCAVVNIVGSSVLRLFSYSQFSMG